RCGASSEKGQHDSQDHWRKRRVGAQDKNAAWTKQSVREQRDDSRVKAVDTWHTGCLSIRDADRNEHRGHYQARAKIVPQPRRLVMTQSFQPWKPAYPACSIHWGNDAARLCSFGGGRFTHGRSNHFSTDEPGRPGACVNYLYHCVIALSARGMGLS